MKYIGHKAEDGRTQPLLDHSTNTAKRAQGFADKFNAGSWGNAEGFLHDIGKYSLPFRRRILEDGPKVDHSTAGAKECMKKGQYWPLAYSIAGHHGGLPDGGSTSDLPDMPTLGGRLKRTTLPDYQAYKEELDIEALIPSAYPALHILGAGGYTLSFFTRMLFSCLVDADFLDTEEFMQGESVPRGNYASLVSLWQKYQKYIERFEQAKTPLHHERNRIQQECLMAGKARPGMFTLTVPTGGGKTISSLGFALKHAQEYPFERIIYVIPYTSIIEQTADKFREILGEENVLEHHSTVCYDADENELQKRHRLATENWDAPVIVTTNVQFFESLYGNRTSKCRKLHNLSRSIIIFDEAQMLPVNYLKPCVRGILELVLNYQCTAVLCSATQPVLGQIIKDFLDSASGQKKCRQSYDNAMPLEICKRQQEMQQFFRRVSIKNIGLCENLELAQRLQAHEQVLCIVNTKLQAKKLAELIDDPNVWHLSTSMTPQHRRHVLKIIRKRLKDGNPCKVISTSLIEAGVDLDFPVVYREACGIDSIIQAAGRCNREGDKSAEEGMVFVFRSEQEYRDRCPRSLQLPISIGEIVLQKYEDVMCLEAIQNYFQTLYFHRGEGMDEKRIVERLEVPPSNTPYSSIAEDFVLIQQSTKAIIIPGTGYSDAEEEQKLLTALRRGSRNRDYMRKAALISVNVYDEQDQSLARAGVLESLDENLAILCNADYYSDKWGLLKGSEKGEGIFA